MPEGLVNAASNTVVPLAPNTIATLYGSNLSFNTRAISADDIRGNVLPTLLPGTGLRILIANQPASLYYVSPTQVNLLIPANLIRGTYQLQVLRDGLAGPKIPVVIEDSAPQLFVLGDKFAITHRAMGSLATFDTPAHPGEIVVVYVTGLGRTSPELPGGQIATTPSPVVRAREFRLYLNGEAVDPACVFYVGLTPGFGGLYQVNFRIPPGTPDNPELRLGYQEPISEPGVRIAVSPPPPSEDAVDPGPSPPTPDPG